MSFIRHIARVAVTGLPLLAATAQPRVVPLVPRTCASCSVHLTRSASFGDSLGAGQLGPSLLGAVRFGDGRLAISSAGTVGFALFAADGQFLERIVPPARAGDTLPAAEAIFLGRGAGDTLHAVDARRATHAVLDARARPVRTTSVARLPVSWGRSLLLPEGELLVTGPVYDAEHVGLPLHIIGRDGNIRASLGADTAQLVPGADAEPYRVLALAGPSRVWSTPPTRYAIERWTLDGVHEITLQRSASWFAPYGVFVELNPRTAPRPWIIDVRQDRRGLLWVLSGVADSGWRASLVARVGRQGDTTYTSRSLAATYDTNIEIIDPQCAVVLFSQRHPELMRKILDDEHLASWSVGNGQASRLTVWQVRASLPEAGATCAARR